MDPTNILQARIATIRQAFVDRYTQLLSRNSAAASNATGDKMAADIATERVDCAIRLFYKQLESLLLMVIFFRFLNTFW